ncbi:MAG: EAL domain-containing protein [Anaerolineaceae bacterium]|nr:EAL domain-containing protein [Anaerolineaceae bacterium]
MNIISKLRITHKSILTLLIITILPGFVLAITVIWINNNALQSSLQEPIQSLACNQLERIDTKVQVINSFLSQVAESSDVEQLLVSNQIVDPTMIPTISTLVDQNPYSSILSLDLFFRNKQSVHFGSTTALINEEWINEWWNESNQDIPIWQAKGENVFVFHLVESNSSQFLLVAGLPSIFFKDVLDDLPAGYGYYLINPQNQLLVGNQSSNGVFPINEYLNQLPSQGELNAGNSQAIICSGLSNWKLILVSPINFAIANNNLLFNTLVITILVISLLLLLFSLFLNKKLIQPIKQITKNINTVNSEETISFEPLPEANYQGEIDELVVEYNKFVQNQKKLHEREKFLDEKRERYELALQGSNIGIWDWNLITNHCYYSPVWRRIIGHTEESIRNLPTEWFTRVHPEDIEALRDEISNHISGKTTYFEHEHRIRHLNETYIWVYARGYVVKGEEGVESRFVGTIENITNRKIFETKLMVDAMYDPLTGLPNRTYFLGIIEQSLGRLHRREDYQSAVLYIDLDRFKTINDKFSITVGDELLLEITRRLKYSLRSMDTIARFSDDKFGVILEEINGLPDTIKITQRLYKEITKPYNFSGEIIQPGTSAGVVILSRGYQDSNEILRDAESAMFQAKANGRGKFEIFDKDNYAFTLSRIQIESELKQALIKNEFYLQYQPIYKVDQKEVFFAEAKLCWKHRSKGLIQNQHYQSIAEESGEIIPINIFTLRKACQEAAEWHIDGFDKVQISVNISLKLLLKPDFAEIVLSALADNNLPNESLQLIIAESSKIYNSGIAIQTMFDLYSIGVKFSLADYGVIPSSLEQLKRLPIQTIRISEALTKDLPVNTEDSSITESIIALGKILGFQVIATGVETEEQAKFLKSKGIHFISGSFFSEPLDKKDFILCLQKGC